MLYAFDHYQTEAPATTTAPVLAPHEPTDEILMSLVKQGEETALATLLHRHTPLLRTIISRVINNDADTEDTVQEVFCEVWRQAAHYSEEKGKALGWIVTLARRRAIDKLRKKQAYHRAEERLLAETESNPIGDTHDVEQSASDADRAEILNRVISTLPDAQQEALKFAFYRGMSQREIAAHTGIPLGTIKTRLELAVRKVRTAVLAMGGTAEWARS